MTPEEEQEMESRAMRLIHSGGTLDKRMSKMTGASVSVFMSDTVMVEHSEIDLVVRLSRPIDSAGMLVFEECFRKRFDSDKVRSFRDRGRAALQAMRQLMILDDLADI